VNGSADLTALVDLSLFTTADGARQVPGDPKVAFTHVYGAPGISACTVMTT
jgi:hypothetical protein